MEPLFEIEVARAAKGSRMSARNLYRQLQAAILDGRLRAGTRLPATRRSAAYFGVSRNTAADVYEQLLNDGYVVTRTGSGTYVADSVKARPTRAKDGKTRTADHRTADGRTPELRAADRAPDHRGPDRRLSDSRLNAFWLRSDVTAAMNFWRDDTEQTSPSTPAPPSIDFRPALVDSRLFPFDVFRRVSARQLRGLQRKPASYKSPQGNQGNYTLRQAITRHIALTRAVVCEPSDVLVTSGAQQAFDLLARALVKPNETVVALEDPGYPPMRVAFAAAGAKLVPVGVDDEGLIVEHLPRDVGVICVCPSHQFPLGVTMSQRRRQALVEFARATGAVIVEDDYDGEFRYDGSPLAALRTAAAADVVFYVGTFSKCMLSSLRLGFLAAPEWAMQTLIAAKNCMDWHCATPLQLGVAAFIAEGHLARHVRKMRETYKKRRRLLLTSIEERLGEWLVPIPSLYGMHVAATARAARDLDAVSDALAKHNVKIHSFSRYYLGPQTRKGLVFGYGAVGLADITRGMALLRKALER